MAVKKVTSDKPKAVRKSRMAGAEVPYYTKTGTKSGTLPLPKEIFGEKPNKVLLAQAVRVFLSNQRKAHAKVKGRGEVDRTKRKVYRQKGTGNARHGARSAPLFVGGGVAHGPRGIENYRLSMSKKMAKKALISAFSAKIGDNGLCVADIEDIEPKTKNVAGFLKKTGLLKATIVHAGNKNLFQAARNIKDISLVPAAQISAYHVISARNLILTKGSLDVLSERLIAKKGMK